LKQVTSAAVFNNTEGTYEVKVKEIKEKDFNQKSKKSQNYKFCDLY
jgi:hypothetical protein